jgi:hypothetical protein
MTYRTGRTATLAAVATLALLPLAGEADAARRRPARREPAAVRVETPLGIQGSGGAGVNVVVPFTLIDARHAPTDVDVQYGVDLNADGVVSDDEFRAATEDRRDPRNTRRNRLPQVWSTQGEVGAAHGFAWRCTADILSGRHPLQDYALTDQGRLLRDPAQPTEFLFEEAQAGVVMRVRAAFKSRGRRVAGAWATTGAFELSNNTRPEMTVDAVTATADGHVQVAWTAFDDDSEDLDADGRLDVFEDVNGNGVLEQEQVGVAFDWCRPEPGQDPSAMTEAELANLFWFPCTRVLGRGDTDSFREPAPGVGQPDLRVMATPNGRAWTFLWDAAGDAGDTVRGPYVLRARPVDAKKEHGATVYFAQPFSR